jgi:hypothetical protein
MEWINNLSVGVVLAFGTVLGTVIGFVIKYFNKLYNIKKGKEDTQVMLSRHDTELKNMTEAMTKMFAIITNQEEESKKTDCAILRNMIIDKFKECKEFYAEHGYITALDYENLSEMFDRYFGRGGNHLISRIHSVFLTWNVSLDESELISK